MKILAVQNRMGIGDTVIFLPFIKAISEKYNSPISLLVKENSKANEFLYETNYIDEILILERGKNSNKKRHNGFFGSINLIQDLKKSNFDKIFIFNSSLRFNLIAKLCYIKNIYQYPLFFKKNQNITLEAQKLLESKMGIKVKSDPQILVDEKKVNSVKISNNISSNEKNILLGIGGSGATKRIPAITFLKFMDYCNENYKCRFFLATGKLYEEQIILDEILNSKFKHKCLRLDNLRLKETLPYIKNCNISICNDSSFSHLSAALGIPTIVLMADTPIIYGSYSPRMHPILPDGVKEVKHDTLGKDKINAQKIYEKFEFLIN